MSESESHLLVEKRDSVMILTMNRPAAKNSLSPQMLVKLSAAWHEFRDATALRVAILTGVGDEDFCAGGDLKRTLPLLTGARQPEDEWDRQLLEGDTTFTDAILRGFELYKPVIAAVNGMAVGGGFELALSTDLIYASDHSSFSLPEIRAGTLADAATLKLPKRIPYHVAMEMLYTGRWMDVEEAHRWGLVNEVLPADKLMDRVWEIAEQLEAGPPLVFASIKEVARETEGMKFQDALNRITKRQFATVDILYGSEDGLEGFKAFAEKREPVWKGK